MDQPNAPTVGVGAGDAPDVVLGWRWLHTAGLLLVALVVVLAFLFPRTVLAIADQPETSTKALWFAFAALLLALVVVAGHGITGVFKGFLVDSRNKMSLSRLQVVLWTVVVLSAFLAAAVERISAGEADPLAIAVPPEVWGLLGISAGSLAGSAIIKSGRTNDDDATLAQVDAAPNASALLNNLQDTNDSPREASPADLFRGELEGSKEHLDVGKVQMFLFTLVVVLAYARALSAAFDASGTTISALPDLSPGMLALLAISHAGYLANKSVPMNPATPTP